MTDSQNSTTGACLCGQVRYRITVQPKFQYLCHCRDCQRMSGSGYLPLLAIPLEGFQIEGDLTFYERTADSGRAAREAFCSRCGSRLFGDGEGIPGVVVVTAGSLDNPNGFTPDAHIHTRSRNHWDTIADQLPQYLEEPNA